MENAQWLGSKNSQDRGEKNCTNDNHLLNPRSQIICSIYKQIFVKIHPIVHWDSSQNETPSLVMLQNELSELQMQQSAPLSVQFKAH